MKTKHLRDFERKVRLDVSLVLSSIELYWVRRLETSSHGELHLLHDFRFYEPLQVSVVGTSIHLIGDMSSIHDLSIEVL